MLQRLVPCKGGDLTKSLTKSQINRLGERLRKGGYTEQDIRLLDAFRLSIGGAFKAVIAIVRDNLKLEPTERAAKSTSSIVEKLRREKSRLSAIQDVAGCRLVAADLAEQDRIVAALCEHFPQAKVIDRRKTPSHGYRAVHVVVRSDGWPIEIQVRTQLQHMWAEFSEKLSDVIDPALKYGGADCDAKSALNSVSDAISRIESLEGSLAQQREQFQSMKEEALRLRAYATLPGAGEIGAEVERIELRTTTVLQYLNDSESQFGLLKTQAVSDLSRLLARFTQQRKL